MKKKKKDFTAKLLDKLKHLHPSNMLWLFSHEKNFYQEEMVKLQTNC